MSTQQGAFRALIDSLSSLETYTVLASGSAEATNGFIYIPVPKRLLDDVLDAYTTVLAEEAAQK